jgi:hypothetical protein
MNKEEFFNRLKESDQVVTFTKKSDGATRVMKCTHNAPTPTEPKAPRPLRSDDVAVVYDKELLDWRSFRLDSVIEIRDDDSQFGLLQE